MKHDAKIVACVFSFNRGRFLENCIQSIEECAPWIDVMIFDDGSTDLETNNVLKKLSVKYTVIRNNGELSGDVEKKTGGLYYLMNEAVRVSHRYEYLIFIQDDMQMVRGFTGNDVRIIKKFFEENQRCIQLQACFFRALSVSDSFFTKYYLDSSGMAYLRNDVYEGGKSNFSAVGVFYRKRIISLLGEFATGEGINSSIARKKGIKMGRSVFPFMNWLPYPESFRGKKKTFYHIVTEKLGKAGFYPIQIMGHEQSKRFLERPAELVPIMERYLNAPTAPRHDIWSTGGGEYNVLAIGGIPEKLLRTALSLRRLMPRCN